MTTIALPNLLLRPRPVLMVQTFVSNEEIERTAIGLVANRTNDVVRNIGDLSCGNIAHYRVEIVKIYTTRTEIKKEKTRETETERQRKRRIVMRKSTV